MHSAMQDETAAGRLDDGLPQRIAAGMHEGLPQRVPHGSPERLSQGLLLTIATPARILVDRAPVVGLRAEDESGAFGVRAGHADLVTLLNASVVRWRTPDEREHYCAVDGGVLMVARGVAVSIACREAVPGESLEALEAQVRRARAARLDAMRRARVEQTRLHAQAVRQMLRYLRAQPPRGEPA